MKQKTSMFGSAMSSYSKPEQSNGETLESQKKSWSTKRFYQKYTYEIKLYNQA